MSELRQDIATKRWVIVAQERAKRPHQFVRQMPTQVEPAHRDDCPFCEGNEGKTPPEVFAMRAGSEPNAPGWQVRVVPNKFAALSPAAYLQVRHPDINTTISGFGAHEVVVETPLHNASLSSLPLEQVEQVLFAMLQRLRTLAQDEQIAFVAVFRNHGGSAGTSLAHPHSQLIATPIVPANLREEIEEARRFYDDRVHCVYCYMLEQEMEQRERMVFETERYAVLAPFASRFPFELLILPKNHGSSFIGEAQHQDITPLAEVVSRTLRLLHHAAGDPDYNMVLHNAPLRDSCMDYYHWHIEILPRLTTAAGFELGTGIYITTAIPEETAAYLRDAVRLLSADCLTASHPPRRA
jgi:UDPglucose--hexose-1-phosphate uridylyltransferase